MFVTSDEEDPDEDGAVDYKYGLAHNHRLLGAVTEASYALSGFLSVIHEIILRYFSEEEKIQQNAKQNAAIREFSVKTRKKQRTGR